MIAMYFVTSISFHMTQASVDKYQSPYKKHIAERMNRGARSFDKTTNCGFSIQFRTPASLTDIQLAQKLLLQEKMNPLFLDPKKFVVAYDEEKVEKDPSSADSVLGFGQIRPLESSASQKKLGSNVQSNNYFELASVYVLKPYRKNGIGSSIITELLHQFDEKNVKKERSDILCLLTLVSTMRFYEQFGFRKMSIGKATDSQNDLPTTLKIEYTLGSFISNVLGNELVFMTRI